MKALTRIFGESATVLNGSSNQEFPTGFKFYGSIVNLGSVREVTVTQGK